MAAIAIVSPAPAFLAPAGPPAGEAAPASDKITTYGYDWRKGPCVIQKYGE